MPGRLATRSAPSPLPGQWGVLPDRADLELLEWADPELDDRVVLLGPNCLELMCALIRNGSLDVSTVRLPDRPEAGCADLVIVANIGGPDTLACAIRHARRALVPLGSVVVGLPTGRAAALASEAIELLRGCGFERIRQRPAWGRSSPTLLRAELPLPGGPVQESLLQGAASCV